MQNLAEQKRVFNSVLGMIVSWVLAVIVFFALFFAGLFPEAGIFGLHFGNYVGDDENGVVEKGDWIICKDYHAVDNPFEDGKEGAFYEDKKDGLGSVTGKELFVKVIEDSYVTANGEKIAIFYHDLNGGVQQYTEIPAQNAVGTVIYGLPLVGYAGNAITATKYSGIIFLVLVMIALIIPPIAILIKRVEVYIRRSPFPEGVNTEKLNAEQLYIYRKIRAFLHNNARMAIRKGYDCDKVYKNKKPFCKIRFYDKAIYVMINDEFLRNDGRIDRNGYIRIEHAYQINDAKDRINEIYLTHFKNRPQQPKTEMEYNGMPNVRY